MAKLVRKGGKGSGNWGHAGRPGKVGGSAPQGTQQSALFDVSEYGGRMVDDAAERRRRLLAAGFNERQIKALSYSDIPTDILEKWYNENATTNYYELAYRDYHNYPYFRQFVENAGDIDSFMSFAQHTGDGLTKGYFDAISEFSKMFDMKFADVSRYVDLLGHGYGDPYWVEPRDVYRYWQLGVRDPDVLAELVDSGDSEWVVRQNILDGADPDSYADVTAPLSPILDAGIVLKEPRAISPPDPAAESDYEGIREKINKEIGYTDENMSQFDFGKKVASPLFSKKMKELNNTAQVASEKQVRSLLGEWEMESNSGSSLDLQAAAVVLFNDVFRTSLSDWQRDTSQHYYDNAMSAMADAIDNRDYDNPAVDVLAASYINTQKFFKKLGITHVRLYRGVRLGGDSGLVDGLPSPGDTVTFHDNALESWSFDKNVADSFALGSSDTREVDSMVIAADVPVERLAGTGYTGIGTISEHEAVVIGSPVDDNYRVEKIYHKNTGD